MARAAVCARTISSMDAPVSSRSRCSTVEPPEFTVSLTSTVVTISRRSGCASMCSGNSSRSFVGKYAWSSPRRYGSSGRSVAISSSATVILV